MKLNSHKLSTRALVLGGGGVTGIAWEVGILTGLLEAGIDLHSADAIIGTSAGAFVGAAVASGYDMNKLFSLQIEPNESEIAASVSEDLVKAWYHAFKTGGSNPDNVGAEFGKIAKKNPEPVSSNLRSSVVEARLVTTDWPQKLQVTAIHADTGKLHVFNESSGVSLIDAVSASGAVPGVWPLVHINGEAWIDGGMVSTTNARLADNYERVVILSPMPKGFGSIPGAAEDAAAMSANANVVLITPDEQSIKAIGPNPYDPTICSAVAIAGRAQSKQIADAIRSIW